MEEVTPASAMVLTPTTSTNSIVVHLLIQITHSYFLIRNKQVITVRFLRTVVQIELVQEGRPTPTRSPLEGLDHSKIQWEATNLFIPVKSNS